MSKQSLKSLFKYVTPAILSNICFFLFSIIDGIFVGRGVGPNGLGALNLVLPFVIIVNAVFMLSTIGGATMVAIRLGKQDVDGANQAFMHSTVLTLILSGILCIAGVFFAGPICSLLGATGNFYELSVEYMFWYSLFIIPSGLARTLQGFCRNDGDPVLVSVAVIVSTIANIFGDWFLVFPMQMGMMGAAVATGVSQTMAFLIVLTHYFPKKKGSLYFHRIKLKFSVIKAIVGNGMPESISQLSATFMTLCFNLVLVREIGEIGVNSFSIISYVASFSMAIFAGISEGIQPLIGMNYGLKDRRSMKFYFHAGLLISLMGSVIVNILLLLIGGNVCALFGADQEILDFTMRAMPRYAWGFCITGLNTTISTYLYSTKRPRQALIINVLRSLIVNSLVITLLPMIFGVEIVWFTFGIYELLVLAVAAVLLNKSERKLALS